MPSETAFVQIIQANEGLIYKIVRAYAVQIDEQKDLYQEIVYQLWKSFDSYRGDAKVSTWMYRIALNTSISYLAKGKRRPVTVEFDLQHLKTSISDTEEKDERIHLLYQHIRSLNLIEKGIILLYLEGSSYEEIGEIIGFTTSNIGTKISRIKEKLKTKIKS